MATRLGDAAEPAWKMPSDASGADRMRAPSVLSPTENPLRGGAAQSMADELASGHATLNPLAGSAPGAVPAPPTPSAHGRSARIAAATRSTSTGVVTWRRVAAGAGVLALCAVVAVVAYVSAGSGDAGASGSSGSGGSSGSANSAGGSVVRVDLGGGNGPASGGDGLPQGPGTRVEGSGNENYVTNAQVQALIAAQVDAPIAELRGTVASLQADLDAAEADLAAHQASLASTRAELNTTSQQLSATSAELARAQADLDAAEARLAAAESAQTATQADLDAAEARLAAAESAQTATQADLDAAEAALAGKLALADAEHLIATSEARTNSTLWVHSSRLSATEDSLDDLESDVSADVATLTSRLDSINTDTPLIANASAEVNRLKFMLGRIGMVSVVSAEMREQRLRQVGNSGIHGARSSNHGSEAWFEGTHVSGYRSIMSIHDHANLRDTVGMGEISAALNGVEFWTRHNDYRLRTPDPANTRYKSLKEIEYPDVPPEVLGCAGNVTCEVEEMRAYFNAWTRQDEGIRAYKNYFKPVLCYLEGWWEVDQDLEDPFSSDRHTIEADSWDDLYRKYRFLAYLGRKNTRENIPFLPTRLWDMKDGLEPIVARWTYRIACQPLNDDVELVRFRIAADLHTQMQSYRPANLDTLGRTRAARFELNPYVGTGTWGINNRRYGSLSEDYLDKLMEQVSGLNSHRVMEPPLYERIPDRGGVNESAYPFSPPTVAAELDMTHYNRYYRVALAGAMGRSVRRRGFKDATMWVAQTSHRQVASLELETGPARATFAIPLEIIYTTPLTKWNPYNFPYDASNSNAPKQGGRNGHLTTASRAYLGSSRTIFYRTPEEFFAGFEEGDAADTSVGAVGVVHPDDPTTIRRCVASGHWINFPLIAGVSQHIPYAAPAVRQRWPIPPVHVSTNVVWQEVKALQAIVSTGDAAGINGDVAIPVLEERRLQMGDSTSGGLHKHYIYLDQADLNSLTAGEEVTTATSSNNMHRHDIKLRLTPGSTTDYYITECDNNGTPTCSHDHPGLLLT